MANQYTTSKSRELTQQRVTLDPRTLFDRFGAWLKYPPNFAKFICAVALAVVPAAFIWLPITVIMLCFIWWHSWQKFELPMRYPKHLGGIDPTLAESRPTKDGKGEQIVQKQANGIVHIGNQRSDDRAEHLKELWLTDSDARTHMLLMGTTGSGKTVTLLSICFNALAWGSGFFYSDGKADSSLHAAVWSLCRRVGREDDYLVINFMTGGADPYAKYAKNRVRGQISEKKSNGTNPWYEGSPDFLSQLSSSLLPKASGDGAQWQQKAVNMMDALIRTLCYERAVGNITLSIAVIREHLALPNLVKLYLKGKRGEIPEFAFLPIKAYLETGLPGFRAELAEKPDKWDQTVFDQHGYLTGQYARTLSMLMDTYGYIFKDRYSEVDMMDVLLNRRILVVMIPTLEKSSQEAANLGKLVVSSIRLMMAMNLGHKLEGTHSEIIDSKATNSEAPYIITMDELGYYFAEGIALMFAQARSLGFMMIAAGQDIAAMAKGENKEEVDSMIANTKLKYTLALEDPDKTLEIFKKVAGEAITVETGSYSGAVGNMLPTNYRAELTGSIQRRDRINLQELKALKEMEGILIFKDQVTRARSFTWFHSARFSKLPYRLNRFLQVDKPTFESMHGKLKPISESDERFTTIDRIAGKVRQGRTPAYVKTVDPVVEAIRSTYAKIELSNPNETPINRGIALYKAAIAAMKANKPDETGRYWDPVMADPETLDAEPPLDVDEGAGEIEQGGVDGGVSSGGGGGPAPVANAAIAPNPAYHQPVLQEKVLGHQADLPRSPLSGLLEEFAEGTIELEAVTTSAMPAAIASEQSAATAAAPVADDDDLDIDSVLQRAAGNMQDAAGEGEVVEQPTSPAIEPVAAPAQHKLVEADPPTKVLAEHQQSEVVIGFTEQATETLVKIEAALGSEDPEAEVRDTEATVSAQLKWSTPVDSLSEVDIEYLFNDMHTKIEKSASRVK